MTGDVVLDVRGLRVGRAGGRRSAGVPLVHGVDLRLCRGEVLGLVGESGAGKSLTALALLGLCPPGVEVSGSVRLLGRELVGLPVRELARVRGRHIAMVFQDALSAFTPVHRVGDQIGEVLRIHQRPRPGRESALRAATELLDAVGVPEPDRAARSYPHQLSGGMRQRAMIAMAMAGRPEVIVADEPTSALDVTVRAQVLEALATARRATGAALLLVSHDLGVVAGTADRVAVMYGGRIVESTGVDALFARPRMPYTKGLIGAVPRIDGETPPTPVPGEPPAAGGSGPGCAFAPRCPLAEQKCREQLPELRGDDGHVAACHRGDEAVQRSSVELFPPSMYRRPPAGGPESEPVLRITGLARSFPAPGGFGPWSPWSLRRGRRTVAERVVHAVESVDLEVRRGETVGLVGESGAGKSTTLLEVMSLAVPQSGTIEILGQDTSSLSRDAARRLRSAVQIVPQDPMSSLDPRMPVGDIVAEPLWVQRMPADRVAARVAEVLRLVGLGPQDMSVCPHRFSGGQRQRIAIARALAARPQLLLLDEPLSALDVSVGAGILDLLRRLREDPGPSCLFVSHDLAVVRQMADRVAVMHAGRVVETGEVKEVFEWPAHPYTRALLDAVSVPDPALQRTRTAVVLRGDPSTVGTYVTGCRFRTRCPVFASLRREEQRRCEREIPATLKTAVGGGRSVACHFPLTDPRGVSG
ncbi:ABC transporter ATP-binding protein [Streptomyces sp. TLI_185]|uniref:dipeptide ABC transporter ATP-binding protein n=1 Tax=Streptomyces sp. TLI_185 TaxID=2485151 RepID=UPI000FA9A09F|nr:ABC transporter ATP-binding protein [Streptomyces sp. TLI_185]RPF32226.1 peptide/nickel transport system ATP-binding protein [Streptomyces sp. TLI_185]